MRAWSFAATFFAVAFSLCLFFAAFAADARADSACPLGREKSGLLC